MSTETTPLAIGQYHVAMQESLTVLARYVPYKGGYLHALVEAYLVMHPGLVIVETHSPPLDNAYRLDMTDLYTVALAELRECPKDVIPSIQTSKKDPLQLIFE